MISRRRQRYRTNRMTQVALRLTTAESDLRLDRPLFLSILPIFRILVHRTCTHLDNVRSRRL